MLVKIAKSGAIAKQIEGYQAISADIGNKTGNQVVNKLKELINKFSMTMLK